METEQRSITRPKVSLTMRVLSWVLVVSFVLAFAVIIHGLIEGRELLSKSAIEIFLLILGALIIVPLAFSIAFTGRPHRWWKYLEDATDLERPIGGHPKRDDRNH